MLFPKRLSSDLVLSSPPPYHQRSLSKNTYYPAKAAAYQKRVVHSEGGFRTEKRSHSLRRKVLVSRAVKRVGSAPALTGMKTTGSLPESDATGSLSPYEWTQSLPARRWAVKATAAGSSGTALHSTGTQTWDGGSRAQSTGTVVKHTWILKHGRSVSHYFLLKDEAQEGLADDDSLEDEVFLEVRSLYWPVNWFSSYSTGKSMWKEKPFEVCLRYQGQLFLCFLNYTISCRALCVWWEMWNPASHQTDYVHHLGKLTSKDGWIDRERERDRETETDRDRQRQTETDRDGERERESYV